MARDDVKIKIGTDEGYTARSVERGINRGIKSATPMRLDSQVNFSSRELKRFAQPLGRITGDMDQFQSSLDASVARVLAFGASASVLAGVGRALKELVNAGIEVEKNPNRY